MNHCPRDLLPDYHRKALEPEVMEDVRTHAAVCADCRETLELLAALDGPVPEPPESFWSTLPGRVTEEGGSRRRWIPAPVWARGLAAAAVLLALARLFLPATEVIENRGGEFFGSPALVSLGLEEEIIAVSGLRVAEIDRSLEEEIDMNALDGDEDPAALMFQGVTFEDLDGESMKIFEELIDEMIPDETERG